MKRESKFNLSGIKFQEFLASFIFILFGIVLLCGIITTRNNVNDMNEFVETIVLTFEGMLGIILGFYFGHRGVEKAEKENKKEKLKRKEAEEILTDVKDREEFNMKMIKETYKLNNEIYLKDISSRIINEIGKKYKIEPNDIRNEIDLITSGMMKNEQLAFERSDDIKEITFKPPS